MPYATAATVQSKMILARFTESLQKELAGGVQ
jgi:hypothetical protein